MLVIRGLLRKVWAELHILVLTKMNRTFQGGWHQRVVAFRFPRSVFNSRAFS